MKSKPRTATTKTTSLSGPEQSAAVVTTRPPSPCLSCAGAGAEAGTPCPSLHHHQLAASQPSMTMEHGLVCLDCLFAPPARHGEFSSGSIPSSWCRVEFLSHLAVARACWLAGDSTAANAHKLAKPFTRCVLALSRCDACADGSPDDSAAVLGRPCRPSPKPLRDHLPVGEECGLGGVVFQDPRLPPRVNSISAMCGATSPPLHAQESSRLGVTETVLTVGFVLGTDGSNFGRRREGDPWGLDPTALSPS